MSFLYSAFWAFIYFQFMQSKRLKSSGWEVQVTFAILIAAALSIITTLSVAYVSGFIQGVFG